MLRRLSLLLSWKSGNITGSIALFRPPLTRQAVSDWHDHDSLVLLMESLVFLACLYASLNTHAYALPRWKEACKQPPTYRHTFSCSYITAPSLSCMTSLRLSGKNTFTVICLSPPPTSPPYPLGQVQMLTLVDFVYIWPLLFWDLQTFMGECKHIVVSRLIAISRPENV